MVIENSTVTMTTTVVYAQQATLPVHIIWIPYAVLVILFITGLLLSFKRHHVRQIKKRKYIVEYQEENLSARMPRIRGKCVDNLNVSCSYEGSLPSPSSSIQPVLSEIGSRPRLLNSDDVNLSFPSQGVKKRFKSTNEIDTLPSYYRLLSEDEYFRRRGDRDSHYYLRCQSERNISPARHKHKVYDAKRSYWIRGDAQKASTEEAVKYIKVFDLDLCHDCRMYVGQVDDKTSEANTKVDATPSPQTEHVCINMDSSVNHDHSTKEINSNPNISCMTVPASPEISIADVHPPPSSVLSSPFRPISSNTKDTPSEIQLFPLYPERPRSAPDLSGETTGSDYFKLGLQDSAFKMRPQFGFNLRRSPAEQTQRRNRGGRDRPGVFWLDLDTYQHTLV